MALERMLEDIKSALLEADYETARVLADEACRYAYSNRIASEYLLDLSLVAYARDDPGLRIEAYRAACDLGLTEAQIALLLNEQIQ
jgi:hypothetical protein